MTDKHTESQSEDLEVVAHYIALADTVAPLSPEDQAAWERVYERLRHTDQESKRAERDRRLADAFGVHAIRLEKLLAAFDKADGDIEAEALALAQVLIVNAIAITSTYRRIVGPGGRRKVEKP